MELELLSPEILMLDLVFTPMKSIPWFLDATVQCSKELIPHLLTLYSHMGIRRHQEHFKYILLLLVRH